mmetsp:Transcript_36033/g.99353  ORF Transcript_36033/g.99353 Transcript_36033/m.99353 type:complete len:420 (-) Transcript_36033:434-1693(-)
MIVVENDPVVHLKCGVTLLSLPAWWDVPPRTTRFADGLAEHEERHLRHDDGRRIRAFLLQVSVGDGVGVFLFAPHGARINDRCLAAQGVPDPSSHQARHARVAVLGSRGRELLARLDLEQVRGLQLAHGSIYRVDFLGEFGVRLVVFDRLQGDFHARSGVGVRGPPQVDNGRVFRIQTGLDDRTSAISMHLVDDFMVVAAKDHGVPVGPCQLDVLGHVLMGERYDLVDLGIEGSQVFVQLLRGVAHRHHGLMRAAESVGAVSGAELAAADAKSRECHCACIRHVVVVGEPHQVSQGQLGLEVRYVRVQPDTLELLDALLQPQEGDVSLMVAETDNVDGQRVQHANHANARIQRTQYRWSDEVAGQRRQHIPQALRLCLDQRLQAREIVELIHVVYADDPEVARPLLAERRVTPHVVGLN